MFVHVARIVAYILACIAGVNAAESFRHFNVWKFGTFAGLGVVLGWIQVEADRWRACINLSCLLRWQKQRLVVLHCHF